ncbi:hypothetical protein DFR57_1192 [Saliterribacillus persicus]|uniref:CAAX prenyl protease 2/Lysostaphin resistance protein A-like domain-containing protein n=1 Tax=Saliterribacillus persicus TaxID=930114 RepID=A0A368X9K2_9BACI|nr:hypothetical protein DFR57_1192 [Saliterribacillus persicus]
MLLSKNYIYVLITYILMQLSSYILLPIIYFFEVDRTMLAVSWSVFSFTAALLVTMYLLRDEVKSVWFARDKKIGSILLWSLVGIFLVYFAQIIAILIETFLLGIKPGSQNTLDLMNVARAAPIFIIIISVLGPILEEVVFRKIIFGSIYKRTNFFIAAIASALVFAAVHNDFSHLLTYTLIGIVFAFLYVHTKRIIVPIIAHMAINTYAVIGQLSMDPEEIEKMLDQLEQLQFILIGG